MRGQRRLFAIILLTYGVALVGTPYSRFLPVFATDVLHAGPSTVRFVIGRAGYWRGDRRFGNRVVQPAETAHALRRDERLFILSWLILFSFCRSLPLSMLFLILVGASNIAFRSVANSVVQMETPPHLLGRMLSLFFMDKGMWSFGTLFIGARRPPGRHAEGNRDFRSVLRCGGIFAALPATSGARKATHRKLKAPRRAVSAPPLPARPNSYTCPNPTRNPRRVRSAAGSRCASGSSELAF